MDATIINASPSTKNAGKARDPEMHQTKKGNEWRFGMKCHIGVDAFSGLVHTIKVTSANAHDIKVASQLIREDDEVVYADSGYLGIEKRGEVASDTHLSSIDYRINRRPGSLQKVSDNSIDWDRVIEHAKSSVRCKVEHPFRTVKCLFGYRKTVYKGLAKNESRLYALFTSANLYALAKTWPMLGKGIVRPFLWKAGKFSTEHEKSRVRYRHIRVNPIFCVNTEQQCKTGQNEL